CDARCSSRGERSVSGARVSVGGARSGGARPMTLVAGRLEALVVARARMAGRGRTLGELVEPLARFAPVALTPAAWRDHLAQVAAQLIASGVLDAKHRLSDPEELARRIGKHSARSWPDLAERVLPGLALGIAADDARLRAKLAGRDAWAAAIVGRALEL